jgi:hypothetical protein
VEKGLIGGEGGGESSGVDEVAIGTEEESERKPKEDRRKL